MTNKRDHDLQERLRIQAANMSVAERFRLLDRYGIYEGTQSRSGEGSDDAQTRALRNFLPHLIKKYEIESVLDAPCGDCRWMSQINFLSCNYTGVDCIPSLISENKDKFPHVQFHCLDILSDSLPSAELIISRDFLIHLSNADVFSVLKCFTQTAAKWLATTTFSGRTGNDDIVSGAFRPKNLQIAPFELPPPKELFREECSQADGTYLDKSMGLWEISELSSYLNA